MPILAAWAVVVVVGAVFGGRVYDRTQSVATVREDAESALAEARLERLAPEGEQVVAVIAGRDFFDPALVESATAVMYEIRELPGVAEVTDAYTAGGLIGRSGESSLAVVELAPDLSDGEALAAADRVAARLKTIDAPEVLVGGEALAERAFAEQAVEDAVRGESVALVVLCVVLVAILGGLVAGSLPLVAALATIAGALLALSGLAGVAPVSEFAVNVVTLLGLGLAVDYSLLIVARFREERAADPRAPAPELLARTMATAGHAVVLSALAVGIALAGLLVVADPLLAAMAMGGALAVLLAALTGLTLVPALIAVAHRRIPPPGTRIWGRRRASPPGPGLLGRLAAFAQRHAAVVAMAVTGGLLLLAAPLLQLDLGDTDARALPAGAEERRAFEAVRREFPVAAVTPITVLVERGPDRPAVARLVDDIRRLPGARDVDLVPELPPSVTALEVKPAGATAGRRAQRLVRAIRRLDAGVPVLVAGPAAELVDAKDGTVDRLPLALAVVLVPTALLLFALTRSVVIPVKALLMNLLTLAATLGVLVAVFQWGWAAGMLGFEPAGALDVTTPLLLFMFIFGLSMDYEMFLLARIKEEWDRRKGEDRAASDRATLAGITASGPVVTTAAVAIGIVFLGFALGELVAVKEIGVGMTVAVLLDVTVVRGLLLPAAMSLLGRWNWWAPWTPTSARQRA